jgi:hypothetical protein
MVGNLDNFRPNVLARLKRKKGISKAWPMITLVNKAWPMITLVNKAWPMITLVNKAWQRNSVVMKKEEQRKCVWLYIKELITTLQGRTLQAVYSF